MTTYTSCRTSVKIMLFKKKKMGNVQAQSKLLIGGGMKRKRKDDSGDSADLRKEKHAKYMKRQREVCTICLEPIKEGQPTLTCHKNSDYPHIFHKNCLKRWLFDNDHNANPQLRHLYNKCPNCRQICLSYSEYRDNQIEWDVDRLGGYDQILPDYDQILADYLADPSRNTLG